MPLEVLAHVGLEVPPGLRRPSCAGERAAHAAGDAAEGPLGELAHALGAGADAAAIAVTLAQPFADVVLLGAATESQLASNLAALRRELPAGALDALAPLREDPASYWSRAAALPWG